MMRQTCGGPSMACALDVHREAQRHSVVATSRSSVAALTKGADDVGEEIVSQRRDDPGSKKKKKKKKGFDGEKMSVEEADMMLQQGSGRQCVEDPEAKVKPQNVCIDCNNWPVAAADVALQTATSACFGPASSLGKPVDADLFEKMSSMSDVPTDYVQTPSQASSGTPSAGAGLDDEMMSPLLLDFGTLSTATSRTSSVMAPLIEHQIIAGQPASQARPSFGSIGFAWNSDGDVNGRPEWTLLEFQLLWEPPAPGELPFPVSVQAVPVGERATVKRSFVDVAETAGDDAAEPRRSRSHDVSPVREVRGL